MSFGETAQRAADAARVEYDAELAKATAEGLTGNELELRMLTVIAGIGTKFTVALVEGLDITPIPDPAPPPVVIEPAPVPVVQPPAPPEPVRGHGCLAFIVFAATIGAAVAHFA